MNGRIWSGGLLLALLLALTGCGDNNLFEGVADDSSTEAKVDAGLEALSDGDYAKAVSILSEVYASNQDDPEIRKYYASALAGNAGVDTLDLMAAIGDAQEANSANSEVFDATMKSIFGIVPGSGGSVDPATIQTKIDEMNKALIVLGGTEDETFQKGFYAAIQVVLVTEKIIGGIDPATVTVGDDYSATFPASATNLNDALALVEASRDSLTANLAVGDTSEIANDFDSFLDEIGFYPSSVAGADGTAGVSEADLKNYLSKF